MRINKTLVGKTHCIELHNVDMQGFDLKDKQNCHFEITYDSQLFTGGISLSEDEEKVLLVFDQPTVALPSESCLTITCDGCDSKDKDEDCPNHELKITDETKVSVLDEDGCPQGFITVGELKTHILKSLSFEQVKFSFCDLVDGDIEQGNLLASDRLLVITDGCAIKTIDASEVVCDS